MLAFCPRCSENEDDVKRFKRVSTRFEEMGFECKECYCVVGRDTEWMERNLRF